MRAEARRDLPGSILMARGYAVSEASTGEDVLRDVPEVDPDVVLLDIGLPDLDGVEVIRRLRLQSDVPVIMLSVRTSEADKIAALEAGADDYLTKPCEIGELLEHVRALVRRKDIEQARLLVSGDLVVDLEHGAVKSGDHRIDLTGAQFEVLQVLVLNAGRLLTQRRLARELWPEKNDQESLHLLRSTIGSLRQKLESDPLRPRRITTEPGVGFRLRIES